MIEPPPEAHYQFAPIDDGLLYVEVPDLQKLVGLVLNQQWRGVAHLRASCGYVPYYGGGIAFHAWPLILRGVKPLWWETPGTDYQVALRAILEETYYYLNTREAESHHERQYKKECEWKGPPGLRFDLEDIAYIWVGSDGLKDPNVDSVVETLEEILAIPVYREPPKKTPFPFI